MIDIILKLDGAGPFSRSEGRAATPFVDDIVSNTVLFIIAVVVIVAIFVIIENIKGNRRKKNSSKKDSDAK